MDQQNVINELRYALEQLKAKLVEQQEFIDTVQGLPRMYGTCVHLGTHQGAPTAIIVLNGQLGEVAIPKELHSRVHPGCSLYLTPEGGLVGVAQSLSIGNIRTVSKIIQPGIAEIHQEGTTRSVIFSHAMCPKLEEGCRVILDANEMVVVSDLGKPTDQFAFAKNTGVSWDDIGGLDEQKALLREAIERPLLYPELYKQYGKQPIKGVLLEGPPGCGKTMLAKAAATSIAKAHKKEGSGFIYVKGPEILSKWVGVAEATIRALFRQAREFKQEHGHAAIIFVDECEAVLSTRGSGISSDIEKTIVPQFLAEMDGLEDSGAMVLLATNRADRLDPGLTRDRRIDRAIRVPRPDRANAQKVFEIHLKGKPVRDVQVEEMAAYCVEEVFNDKLVLYQINRKSGQDILFRLGSILNGAMCFRVIDEATSVALERDMASGQATGITKEDVKTAVDKVMKSNQSLDHSQELAEVVGDIRQDVSTIRRVGAEAA